MLNSKVGLCLNRDGNIFEVNAQLIYETHKQEHQLRKNNEDA